MSDTPCPCQSGLPYRACCQPLHNGAAADSPEALMRSRYSAFAAGLTTYLQQTWHPTTRPASLSLDNDTQWVGLDILDSGDDGTTGWVQFRATCRDRNGFAVLEETSTFLKEDGRWLYRDGDHQLRPLKPGRNDPCPCGSGNKFKKCCG